MKAAFLILLAVVLWAGGTVSILGSIWRLPEHPAFYFVDILGMLTAYVLGYYCLRAVPEAWTAWRRWCKLRFDAHIKWECQEDERKKETTL